MSWQEGGDFVGFMRFFKHSQTKQERWDRSNLRTLSCKLPAKKAAEFDAIVKGYGLTRYEAIRRFCVAVTRDPSLLSRLPWH